jgi:hypothetical protein
MGAYYCIDMPTQFNSPLYDGHFPATDAASVRILRNAGALIFGMFYHPQPLFRHHPSFATTPLSPPPLFRHHPSFATTPLSPPPLFRHHPSFARQNKKSSTKTHQLHLHESQLKYIATQEKLPLLIIKMIGCDDSDLIRLCGVRDLCVLCYGNVVSLITKFLTALCLVFWSLSLTTT